MRDSRRPFKITNLQNAMKVLMILTSDDKLGDTGKKTGF
jgi:hypothetical protein